MLRGKSKEYYDELKKMFDDYNDKDEQLKIYVHEFDIDLILRINPALAPQYKELRKMPDFIIPAQIDGKGVIFVFINDGFHDDINVKEHVKVTRDKVTFTAKHLLDEMR